MRSDRADCCDEGVAGVDIIGLGSYYKIEYKRTIDEFFLQHQQQSTHNSITQATQATWSPSNSVDHNPCHRTIRIAHSSNALLQIPSKGIAVLVAQLLE